MSGGPGGSPRGDAVARADATLREQLAVASQVLRDAATLLEQPASWTTGVLARDASDRPVSIAAPGAVRFCLAGAVVRAAHDAGEVEPIATLAPNEPSDAPLGVPAGVALTLVHAAALVRWRVDEAGEVAPSSIAEMGARIRLAEAEAALVATREVVTYLCSESGRRAVLALITDHNDAPEMTHEHVVADLALAEQLLDLVVRLLYPAAVAGYRAPGWRCRRGELGRFGVYGRLSPFVATPRPEEDTR